MDQTKLDFNIEDDLEYAMAIAARLIAFLRAEAARSGKTERQIVEDHLAKRGKAADDMQGFLDSLPEG